MIGLHVLYMWKALLTSSMTDIHSQFNLRAYGPPDKKGGEGSAIASLRCAALATRQRASPSALPIISGSQTHYLLPQERDQHCIEDKE